MYCKVDLVVCDDCLLLVFGWWWCGSGLWCGGYWWGGVVGFFGLMVGVVLLVIGDDIGVFVGVWFLDG